jgi:threonine dehydratase
MTVTSGRLEAVLTTLDVTKAAGRIEGHVRRTPVLEVAAGDLAEVPLVLKLELLQRAGSFKARGAFNFLLAHAPSRVVTASGGNHGLAVATAAAALGVTAEVFVPESIPATKLDGLAAAGASVVQVGAAYSDAAAAARRHASERDLPYLHAYDHPDVVAAQGTAALELLADAPGVDTILVAVGGGGLIAGTIAAVAPRVGVVGVEPQRCPTLHAAIAHGRPVEVEVGGVAVDSLGAATAGTLAYELVTASGTRSVLVPDAEIVEARAALWRALRLAVEPAAATALAALRCGAYVPRPGERVALLLCGGNASPAELG